MKILCNKGLYCEPGGTCARAMLQEKHLSEQVWQLTQNPEYQVSDACLLGELNADTE